MFLGFWFLKKTEVGGERDEVIGIFKIPLTSCRPAWSVQDISPRASSGSSKNSQATPCRISIGRAIVNFFIIFHVSLAQCLARPAHFRHGSCTSVFLLPTTFSTKSSSLKRKTKT